MSEPETSITQDLEHLFKKTTDANKIFFSESAKFVKQLSASGKNGEDLLPMGKQLFKDAFNLFVKLNIQHTSNLIDLGVSLSRRLNQQSGAGGDDALQSGLAGEEKPAFVLNMSGRAGADANAQFLLDSDKKEPLFCNLKQTDFMLSSTSIKYHFETTFLPQSFQLLFGEPVKVNINVKIPPDAREGVYRSNIRVYGFEHTFFSLILNVSSDQELNKTPE